MKKILLLLICLFLHVSLAGANLIKDDFLSGDLGVRPVAMGNSYVAVADDVNALFINSAGLMQLEDWSLLTSSGSLYGMGQKSMFAVGVPTDVGNVAVGFVSLTVPDNLRADVSGNVGDSFIYGDRALFVGYAVKPWVEWLSLGLTGKYLIKESGADQVTGLGVDVSALINTEYFNIGGTIMDVTETTIGNDHYPVNYRIGVAIKPIKNVVISSDYLNEEVMYGAEWNLSESLGLMVGYSYENISFGSSLKFSGFVINGAYKAHDLGESLTIEIGF